MLVLFLGFRLCLGRVSLVEHKTGLTLPVFFRARFSCRLYIKDHLGPVVSNMAVSGRVSAATGDLMLGEELGLHKSNKLP